MIGATWSPLGYGVPIPTSCSSRTSSLLMYWGPEQPAGVLNSLHASPSLDSMARGAVPSLPTIAMKTILEPDDSADVRHA